MQLLIFLLLVLKVNAQNCVPGQTRIYDDGVKCNAIAGTSFCVELQPNGECCFERDTDSLPDLSASKADCEQYANDEGYQYIGTYDNCINPKGCFRQANFVYYNNCPGNPSCENCPAGTFDNDGDQTTACVQFRTCATGLVTKDEGTTTTDRTCKCAPGTEGRGVTKEDVLNSIPLTKTQCLEAAIEARAMATASKSPDGNWGNYYGFDYAINNNVDPTDSSVFEYNWATGQHGCFLYVHTVDYTRILWNNLGSDNVSIGYYFTYTNGNSC